MNRYLCKWYYYKYNMLIVNNVNKTKLFCNCKCQKLIRLELKIRINKYKKISEHE